MAKELINTTVTQTGRTLHTDTDPVSQPKGTHRFALNAVNEARDGQQGFLSNERANYQVDQLPEGYYPIGDVYIGDDTSAVIARNEILGREIIATINKDNKVTIHVDTAALGLSITKQCDVIFRLRRGFERVIYWVNGYHKPRLFNLDRPHNFYTEAYSEYLRLGGVPSLYTLEKWDESSFNLQKTYKSIPNFSNIEIIETGNILSGSYNFAVCYTDEDLNSTEWITTSNTANIYVDNSNNPYEKIRGSRNITSDSQSFPRASKSIRLTITILDTNFPYYRVAIIQGNDNTGLAVKALMSELIPTSDSTYTYTGNDTHLTEINLADILIDNEVIFAPDHIEQLENRCLLANTKGKDINWCEFQKYASKIYSDQTTKEVILNNIASDANVKNAKSTFFFHGYMPGDVYAFNIHYVFPDYVSPGFHIPGKGVDNKLSKMEVYELENRYLDIHNCSTDNYWGSDCDGNSLVGKPVRMHRFPFRKTVGKSLVTRVSDEITLSKYRLFLKVTLNPSYTPGPNVYPTDSEDAPLSIPFTINYEIEGAATGSSFNGTLTDIDMGELITVYDNTQPLTNTTIVDYGELDSGSTLATYQPGTNDRFILEFTYEDYEASSSIDNDTSEIFGISFSNIERPHPDCTGFYITRAERTDDDKMILDNAIIGGMTEFEQYKSFGLLMPKQYYPVQDHLGNTFNSTKTVQYFNKGFWFFNPEFQFFHKKIEFDRIEVEGTYTESSVQMPTISNREGSPFNHGVSKGVYIDDVQAGSSYNPDVHKKKDKDDDGFDLIIGYRNTNVAYTANTVTTLPEKERVMYLNATAYQNYLGNTYYNTSVDNKIGLFITGGDVDTNLFYNTGTTKNALLYGAMVRNGVNLYSNFMTRPFYKEHNNPIMFGDAARVDGVEIFNGDTQISATNVISSVFSDMVVADRKKKSRVWKIVVGAVLVVAGIVLAIPTAGAGLGLSAAGAALFAGLAISYGVSLAVSGIKFEQFKKMVDTDYEKGLKETVSDGGTYETIREDISRDDDTIRWFADRVSNIYIESSVPFGLRSGLTSGVTDFIDAPAPFNEEEMRSYLTEKLTVIDRDQGSGRLYKGYATAEVYDMNKDYLRFNKQKEFIHLPLEYDCCSDNAEKFPMRVWYSEQSFQEEKSDNYSVFKPNNYRDIEGEHGQITDLYRLGDNLYIQTREALWHLPQNNQERVTDELTTFIGTGTFFSIPPKKIIDDKLGGGGSQHKWATVKTEHGVAFINELEGKVYLHADKLRNITIGNRNYFKETFMSVLSKQFFDELGIDFGMDNNPANPFGIGYCATYDKRYERILITKKDFRYLGDFSKLITDFKPGENYEAGQIIVDEKGFREILSFAFEDAVKVTTATGWSETTPVLSKPVLVGDYDEFAPLSLNFGSVYMKNGDIYYLAEIGAPAGSTDDIVVNAKSCENDTIRITITE